MNLPPESSSESPTAPGAAPEPVPVRLRLPDVVPSVTYSIVGLTAAVYVLQLLSTFLFGYAGPGVQLDWLEFFGARINSFIQAGEIWRFLTPVLLHASVPHILFNMYALVSFGTDLERHFGHGRFLLLYLLGAFAGNVLSFLLTRGYSVGASTAIFGLVGAEGVFLYQNRTLFGKQVQRAIGNVVFIVIVNLLLGLSPGIDNWGHVGGLLGGLMFAWFGGPLWEVEGIPPSLYLADKRQPHQIFTGAALVVLLFGLLALARIIFPAA